MYSVRQDFLVPSLLNMVLQLNKKGYLTYNTYLKFILCLFKDLIYFSLNFYVLLKEKNRNRVTICTPLKGLVIE